MHFLSVAPWTTGRITVAHITLSRDSGWTDRIRKYNILIDGKVAAEIGNGETITLPVSPGIHTVQARLDWARSPALTFNTEGGSTRFRVLSNLRGWRVMLAVIYAFLPMLWIRLEKAG